LSVMGGCPLNTCARAALGYGAERYVVVHLSQRAEKYFEIFLSR